MQLSLNSSKIAENDKCLLVNVIKTKDLSRPICSHPPRGRDRHYEVHDDIIDDDEQKFGPEEVERDKVATESGIYFPQESVLDQAQCQEEQEGVNCAREKQEDLQFEPGLALKFRHRKVDYGAEGCKHAVYLAFVFVNCFEN